MKRVKTGFTYVFDGGDLLAVVRYGLVKGDKVIVIPAPGMGGKTVSAPFCHVRRVSDGHVTMVYKSALQPDKGMARWKRQLQERTGDYFFSGRGLITAGVNHALTPIEVAWIDADLKRAVHENDGLDYLQVFKCDDGRTVWAIDQLSQSMKEGDGYTPDYDHWTLLLPEEY